jgi:hypothetical protein
MMRKVCWVNITRFRRIGSPGKITAPEIPNISLGASRVRDLQRGKNSTPQEDDPLSELEIKIYGYSSFADGPFFT